MLAQIILYPCYFDIYRGWWIDGLETKSYPLTWCYLFLVKDI